VVEDRLNVWFRTVEAVHDMLIKSADARIAMFAKSKKPTLMEASQYLRSALNSWQSREMRGRSGSVGSVNGTIVGSGSEADTVVDSDAPSSEDEQP